VARSAGVSAASTSVQAAALPDLPFASDLKVVEMVLTGSINTDLVTLLNQEGGQAVGVSGKDGALLRVRKLQSEGRDLGQVGEITARRCSTTRPDSPVVVPPSAFATLARSSSPSLRPAAGASATRPSAAGGPRADHAPLAGPGHG